MIEADYDDILNLHVKNKMYLLLLLHLKILKSHMVYAKLIRVEY